MTNFTDSGRPFAAPPVMAYKKLDNSTQVI
jgi:hypothetical protein